MKILGAEVVPVFNGSQTLKDAVSEGLRYWISHIDDSYYCMGSVVGPHPYPLMVRDFQKVIGNEIHQQILEYENCSAKCSDCMCWRRFKRNGCLLPLY